jgi:hypothetical protein
MCEDDIIDLGLQNHDLAKEILLLMEEVCWLVNWLLNLPL